jgi:hypothetical protein
MSSEHIIVRKDGAVMSRLETGPGQAPGTIFWMPRVDSELVNHRYAVRYPSADAAERGALTYDATARELATCP